MGGRFSRKKREKTAPEVQAENNNYHGITELAELFPSWEAKALQDVLLTCHGDQTAAIQTVLEWSKADHDGPSNAGFSSSSSSSTATSSATTTTILPAPDVIHDSRLSYDKFMKAHLLKHETPAVQAVTLKAATLLIARAHLAKKIVRMRKAQIQCLSDVATPPPMLRSYSEEEKDMDEIRSQMSREEKIDDGEKLLQQRVNNLNLRIIHMKDDGNCQFRALSHELYGHQRWHQTVRTNAVNYLISNTEKFSFFVGEASDWNQYIQKMSITKTWGDELTLRAAAEFYQVTIHVITTERKNWLLHYYGKESGDDPSVRSLFLAYISPIHYNVICPQ
jgi:hypothetical protein